MSLLHKSKKVTTPEETKNRPAKEGKGIKKSLKSNLGQRSSSVASSSYHESGEKDVRDEGTSSKTGENMNLDRQQGVNEPLVLDKPNESMFASSVEAGNCWFLVMELSFSQISYYTLRSQLRPFASIIFSDQIRG